MANNKANPTVYLEQEQDMAISPFGTGIGSSFSTAGANSTSMESEHSASAGDARTIATGFPGGGAGAGKQGASAVHLAAQQHIMATMRQQQHQGQLRSKGYAQQQMGNGRRGMESLEQMHMQLQRTPSGSNPNRLGNLPQPPHGGYFQPPNTFISIDPSEVPHYRPIPNVQHYGTSYAPPVQEYHAQGRRASSPAAMFAPPPGGMVVSQARSNPPPITHHPASDFAAQGWQPNGFRQTVEYGDPQSLAVYPQPLQERYPPGSSYAPPPPPPPHMMEYQQFSQGQHMPAHPLDSMSYNMEEEEEDMALAGSSRPPFDPYRVKHRKRTSPEQLAILESAFDANSKPSAVERKSISERIGMTSRAVQVWFQNRRQKRKLAERKMLDSGGSLEGETDIYGRVVGMPHSVQMANQRGYYGNPVVSPNGVNPSDGVDDVHGGWSSTPANGIHHPGHDVPHHIRPQLPQVNRMQSSDNLRRQGLLAPSQSGVPTRPSPLISQARRGSLPYPTPVSITIPHHAQIPHPQVRVAYPMPLQSNGAQMPLHLAVSMNNLRRSSLPGNARSVSGLPPASAGSGMADYPNPQQQQDLNGSDQRARNQRLSPIEDQELVSEAEAEHDDSQFGYLAGPPRDSGQPHVNAQMQYQAFSGDEFPSQARMQGDGVYTTPNGGILPNPTFSFGSTKPKTRQDDSSTLDSVYAQPQGSVQDILPSIYRGRIGSMASILSQATTDGGATTDGTSSDMERYPFMYAAYQQAIAPVDTTLVTPLEGPTKGLAPPTMAVLPYGFQADARRASAPAQLLAKFSSLDVEIGPNTPHRPSPLGSAILASPDDTGSCHPSYSQTPKELSPSGGPLSASPLSARPIIAQNQQRTPSNSDSCQPTDNDANSEFHEKTQLSRDEGPFVGPQNSLQQSRNGYIDFSYMYNAVQGAGLTGMMPSLEVDSPSMFVQHADNQWMYVADGLSGDGRDEGVKVETRFDAM